MLDLAKNLSTPVLTNIGELKKLMKARDLEMKHFIDEKDEEIRRVTLDNNKKQKEIEELKSNRSKDHKDLEVQNQKLKQELEVLKQAHGDAKDWGDFKEREVDKIMRHLVFYKNKMRDTELANKQLSKKIDSYA